MSRLRPELDGHGKQIEGAPLERKLLTLGRPWPIYLLIVLVLGGIYGGLFTPTEAGAVGAFGALCILIASRKFSWRGGVEIMLETGKATATIFFLLIAATMYSRMLTLSGLPTEVTNFVSHLEIAPILVVLGFLFILLVLGMILDSVSILLLTMPIMAPVVITLGMDPVWFGILAILVIELGLLTPPFGIVIFAMKSALPNDVSLEDIYIGAAPFLIVLLIVVGILLAFPQITLFLPQMLAP